MDKRVYLVTKRDNNLNKVVGIFTNQKQILDGLAQVVNVDKLYLAGARKNKQVTPVNLNVSLQSPKRVDIYDIDTNDISVQITQIGLNHINPVLKLKD